ncbi:MAG: T9SS type A sorting domain-containing protein [Saprospiraceae bacterium]
MNCLFFSLRFKFVCIVFFLIPLLLNGLSAQKIIEVGPGKTYSNPQAACLQALAGDTVLIYPGKYSGGIYIDNLIGKPNARISIIGTDANAVIIEGGVEAFHFSQLEYVNFMNLTIRGQSGNGVNMDDAGTYESPSKHVLISNVSFLDMNASGNNDMLKLSGLDSFEIRNCNFSNGSAGGSGIDMVGCHYGWIHNSLFVNQGSNSIQIKGGCNNIHIEANKFKNGGQRALNLGGSTGTAFFRPLGANYEAKNLLVNSNYFIGSESPIAYVGCRNVQVSNNTFVNPTKWIFRILQESSDTNFYQSCANNIFSNNIVYCSNLSPTINIGPLTSEKTFRINNNLWYNAQIISWRGPTLPVVELNGVYSQDPLFEDVTNEIINLKSNSPAIGKGLNYVIYNLDYNLKSFKNPPAIGATEFVLNTLVESIELNALKIFPNPCRGLLQIKGINGKTSVNIYSIFGVKIKEFTIETNALLELNGIDQGSYFVVISGENQFQSQLLIINK